MARSTLALCIVLVGALILEPRSSNATLSETILYSFARKPDGQFPVARLMRSADGSLYGTTASGGGTHCHECGTVFKLSTTSDGYSESNLHQFQGGLDGDDPVARLYEDKNGNIFGTTQLGGYNDNGTVFEIRSTASGYTFQTIYRFQGAPDGTYPQTALIGDASGTLYGTTASGGLSNECTPGCGTAFELKPNSSGGYTESVIYRFHPTELDGYFPSAPLVMDGAGNLFGTTSGGGVKGGCESGCGTVFRLTPTGSTYTETIIHRFKSFPNGGQPYGGLLLDDAGALYGTTANGGYSCNSQGCGTVFKLNPRGSTYGSQTIYRFKPSGDGEVPESNLVMDKDGVLYGTTIISNGLALCNCGTVFALTPVGAHYTETILHAFGGKTHDGANPSAGLVLEQPTRTLYGTTEFGGKLNNGAVFQLRL